VSALLALLLLAPPVLPDRIAVKTPTRSFTASHYLALEDGRLWWRANPETTGRKETWSLVPPDGLPIGTGRLEAVKELIANVTGGPDSFVRPTRLVELTADGDNVIVVGDDGTVFYAKLPGLEWTNVWGPAGFKKPLKIDFLHRGLAISHRKGPYEDIDGNSHPVTVGVTTFYALSGDGRTLSYTDPWLPANFGHQLCLPLHGQWVGAGLSASASTIFVIDSAGRGFTRLADFDTIGLDPTMVYSWEREKRSGLKAVIRSLPPEDWVAQPPLPGKATNRITVLQTGPGNAARELRVEGEGGYYRKAIRAPAWEFVQTGEKATGVWADPPAIPPAPEPAPVLRGLLKDIDLELRDFDVHCSPAKVRMTKGKEVLDLELHFRGEGEHLKGALIFVAATSPNALKMLEGKKWAAVEIDASFDTVLVSDRTLKLKFSR
jgi:hypothetical protein